MPYRAFKFHAGGGSLEYEQEAVRGLVYGDQRRGATLKDVSPSIYRLMRNGEWCPRCDLELPEPISSQTIESTVLRAVRRGEINLAGMPWSMIAGRLNEQRCPACGALMTEKMLDQELI